ncbi:MAG TPA: hypothetical protein VJB96_05100 [Patescibacteria group bacterium]|nr:hypothetical protein [Patescibacteria group bacterium]
MPEIAKQTGQDQQNAPRPAAWKIEMLVKDKTETITVVFPIREPEEQPVVDNQD